MDQEIRLPELGENIEEAEVVQIFVKPGDTVRVDQSVLEVETEKAALDVPATVGGLIKSVSVQVGAKIRIGDVLMIVETPDTAVENERPTKTSQSPPQTAERTPSPSAEMPQESLPASEKKNEKKNEKKIEAEEGNRHSRPLPPSDVKPVPASPAVRRLARELGVDIVDVAGTGPGGRIAEEDVKEKARSLVTGARQAVAPSSLPDFQQWGAIRREPLRSVRRETARHLAQSWQSVVHVTQHDTADVTEIERLRLKYAPRADAVGGKLTITAILVKIIAEALKKFPAFAASLDVDKEELIFKNYVHIGIAVDTDRGLLVPVIRDADSKSLLDLSVELGQMAARARNKELKASEMQGGCFTITNLGGIGGTSFTPIVNWPEVAILGISRTRQEPVFREDRFEPRLCLPLSLSYDHRVIDGATAARFLHWIVAALEEPFILFLES